MKSQRHRSSTRLREFKLRKTSSDFKRRQGLQSVSEAPKRAASGESVKLRSLSLRGGQRSSEARGVRSFRASVKLRSASRQELQSVSEELQLQSVSEVPKRVSSGASEIHLLCEPTGVVPPKKSPKP